MEVGLPKIEGRVLREGVDGDVLEAEAEEEDVFEEDSPQRSASMSCVSSGEMKRQDGHHDAVHRVMSGWFEEVESASKEEKSSALRMEL